MMRVYFFILISFVSKSGFSQQYSLDTAKFNSTQYPNEQRFIHFMKTKQIDSCLSEISTETILKFGTKELKMELENLNSLYKKFGNPKYTWEICNSAPRPATLFRVGCYGHDIKGTIEKKCSYHFENSKGEDQYDFTLYYWNYQNFGIIKYFTVYDAKKHANDFILDEAPSPDTTTKKKN